VTTTCEKLAVDPTPFFPFIVITYNVAPDLDKPNEPELKSSETAQVD
jgi:hypothetical protein